MVILHCSFFLFVPLGMWTLLADFEMGAKISLTPSESADIMGICKGCVIGVDLATGVNKLVVPGRVFTWVGHTDIFSPSGKADLN